eukprot:1160216-Pelagomonas_calceolata.AAC.2
MAISKAWSWKCFCACAALIYVQGENGVVRGLAALLQQRPATISLTFNLFSCSPDGTLSTISVLPAVLFSLLAQDTSTCRLVMLSKILYLLIGHVEQDTPTC